MHTNTPSDVGNAATFIAEIYGQDVFNMETMRGYLPRPVYKKLLATIRKDEKLDPDIANEVAQAMMTWALEKGASHYTHWFQPLNGSTAEKHDSFVEVDPEGNLELKFSGKSLVQGEPDASSFPSGGLRATFEARGYTAWDPTSPAFIKRTDNGATLCIPTAFCSYKGQALDKKTPLLRSMTAVCRQAQRLLACFGGPENIHVTANLGAEQEYFLVDKQLYALRPDLMMCGRTLFGNVPPKHQQMEDHYFGSIKDRVLEFMVDVDEALWKLGIPSKTRHNEVAPGQFEIAPIFESQNLAVDHNMLVMEVLRKTANKHDLVCLLHEKPFAGMNGSGKHNNWSLSAPGYGSLLNPGSSPQENAIFLTLLCATIKAVDEHADLLRASVAKSGNEHRLGAHEAPPAIISIFLGDLLDEIIEQIEKGGTKKACTVKTMSIGVDTLPMFPLDTSDRNRTSPFAFTGNKFEFRMPGSAENLSDCNTILNTAVAKALKEFVAETSGAADFECAAAAWVKKTLNEHRRVVFNGNGYTEAWEAEAERRGLPNRKNTPDAMVALTEDKNVALMEEFGVLTKTEMFSRHEVEMEHYSKILNIEARTMLKIANKQLIPAATAYMGEVAGSAAAKTAAVEGISTKAETKVLTALTQYADEMSDAADALKTVTDKVTAMTDECAKAHAFHDEVIPAMDALRAAADKAEEIIDEEYWPLPCYSRMLFYTE